MNDELNANISKYVQSLACVREDRYLARLRAATAHLPLARMQISPEQGLLLALLARMVNAKRAIEVGVFTGYSALCVARALPADGRLVACDISEEWTSIGKPIWREAGVGDRIDLRLGPASNTLADLIAQGESASFDFAFIDADKEAYDVYYEQCLVLLRPGGVMAIDNIFMDGDAIAPTEGDSGALAVHSLTKKIYSDPRVEPAVIPIRDGVLVAWKR